MEVEITQKPRNINVEIEKSPTINVSFEKGVGGRTFTGLNDTPTTYTDQAGKILQVNSTETGLEFTDSPTVVDWDEIGGTQSDINISGFTNDSGYLTSYTETDPIFVASPAHSITSQDLTDIQNLSGTNTGDQDLSGYELLSNKSTNVTTDGASDTKYPSVKAVKTYADNILGNANALVYKGTIDCSLNPNYPSADAGWLYVVSVAGKIGGASGIDVEVGDMCICNTDGTVSGDQATVGTKWNVIQKNIVGAVTGPASSTDGNFALFDGVTGKIIKNSSVNPSSFLTLDQTTSQSIINGQPIQNTLTASELVSTDANKKFQSLPVATYPSLTEISYVKGLSSAVQTQLNDKLNIDQTTPQTTVGKLIFPEMQVGTASSTWAQDAVAFGIMDSNSANNYSLAYCPNGQSPSGTTGAKLLLGWGLDPNSYSATFDFGYYASIGRLAGAGDLVFNVANSGVNNFSEALRIKQGTGNVLIGTDYDVYWNGGIKLRVYGASDYTPEYWNGRIVAGGDYAVFLLGENMRNDGTGHAWLGAHNGTLTTWEDIYINPDGLNDVFIGNRTGTGLFGGDEQPILSVKNSTGNVLIGTDTDDGINRLQVAGSVQVTAPDPRYTITSTDHTSNPGFVMTNTVGQVGSLFIGGIYGSYFDSLGFYFTTTNFKFLDTYGNTLLNLQQGGNLLLGSNLVDDGVNKLQVNGRTKTTSLTFDNSTAYMDVGYEGGFAMHYANGGTFLMTELTYNNNVYFQAIPTSLADMVFEQYTGTNLVISSTGNSNHTTTGNITFRAGWSNPNSERMRITGDTGNVLIGTNTDDGYSKLNINGTTRTNKLGIGIGDVTAGGTLGENTLATFAVPYANATVWGMVTEGTNAPRFALNTNSGGSFTLFDGVGGNWNIGLTLLGGRTILGGGPLTDNGSKLQVNGSTWLGDKLLFTQTDGNEYIDSLADGYMDYGATTAHRFLANVKLTADNRKLLLGAGDDVSVTYNGTDTIFTNEVGSGEFQFGGVVKATGYKSSDGSAGITTTFVDADGNTIGVKDGLIVSKTAP